jgi:hypothetical protein
MLTRPLGHSPIVRLSVDIEPYSSLELVKQMTCCTSISLSELPKFADTDTYKIISSDAINCLDIRYPALLTVLLVISTTDGGI